MGEKKHWLGLPEKYAHGTVDDLMEHSKQILLKKEPLSREEKEFLEKVLSYHLLPSYHHYETSIEGQLLLAKYDFHLDEYVDIPHWLMMSLLSRKPAFRHLFIYESDNTLQRNAIRCMDPSLPMDKKALDWIFQQVILNPKEKRNVLVELLKKNIYTKETFELTYTALSFEDYKNHFTNEELRVLSMLRFEDPNEEVKRQTMFLRLGIGYNDTALSHAFIYALIQPCAWQEAVRSSLTKKEKEKQINQIERLISQIAEEDRPVVELFLCWVKYHDIPIPLSALLDTVENALSYSCLEDNEERLVRAGKVGLILFYPLLKEQLKNCSEEERKRIYDMLDSLVDFFLDTKHFNDSDDDLLFFLGNSLIEPETLINHRFSHVVERIARAGCCLHELAQHESPLVKEEVAKWGYGKEELFSLEKIKKGNVYQDVLMEILPHLWLDELKELTFPDEYFESLEEKTRNQLVKYI